MNGTLLSGYNLSFCKSKYCSKNEFETISAKVLKYAKFAQETLTLLTESTHPAFRAQASVGPLTHTSVLTLQPTHSCWRHTDTLQKTTWSEAVNRNKILSRLSPLHW